MVFPKSAVKVAPPAAAAASSSSSSPSSIQTQTTSSMIEYSAPTPPLTAELEYIPRRPRSRQGTLYSDVDGYSAYKSHLQTASQASQATQATHSVASGNTCQQQQESQQQWPLPVNPNGYTPSTMSEAFGLRFAPGRDDLKFQGPAEMWAGTLAGNCV
ncbi:hypothetical protein HK102_004068, partial [Quaeritorhiza haematococci]